MPDENAPGFVFRRPDRQTNDHGDPTPRYQHALGSYRVAWAIFGTVASALIVSLASSNREEIGAVVTAAIDAWSQTD